MAGPEASFSTLKSYWQLFRAPLTPVYRLIIQPISVLFLPLVVRLPLHPNVWTLLCLSMKLLAGWRIYQGHFDGWLILWLILGMVFDSFDGAVARFQNKSSYSGAFLDRAVDQIGYTWIMSCFLAQLVTKTDLRWFFLLSIAIIGGSILHETLRTWVSLTGGLLEERDAIPAWDQSFRNHGLLLFYGHDTAFFLIGLGVIFQPLYISWALVMLIGISLGYQCFIHSRGARQCGTLGQQLWKAFHKKGLVRVVFLGLLSLPVYFIYLYSEWILVSLLLVWVEFLVFYFWANLLMSESARVPDDPDEKEEFLKNLQKRDRKFLLEWYP